MEFSFTTGELFPLKCRWFCLPVARNIIAWSKQFITNFFTWVAAVRYYNLLLIRNLSKVLTIHKAKILSWKPHEKHFLDFNKWVKNI